MVPKNCQKCLIFHFSPFRMLTDHQDSEDYEFFTLIIFFFFLFHDLRWPERKKPFVIRRQNK